LPLLPPRKIEDKARYANAMEVLDAVAGITLNQDQEEGEREITVDLARTLARQVNVDASLFLALPNLEDESTQAKKRKNKKLGVWQKYRVTAADYRRYHKRKIAFSVVRQLRHYAHPNLNRKGVPENCRNSGRGTAAPVE
jgi:hypothetical protein